MLGKRESQLPVNLSNSLAKPLNEAMNFPQTMSFETILTEKKKLIPDRYFQEISSRAKTRQREMPPNGILSIFGQT